MCECTNLCVCIVSPTAFECKWEPKTNKFKGKKETGFFIYTTSCVVSTILNYRTEGCQGEEKNMLDLLFSLL